MNEEQTQEGQQQWDSWLSRALQGKGLFLHGLRPIDVEKSIDLLQRTMDVPPGGTRWSNRARTGETPYRYFRIRSAPSVLSLRTSGYRDLLATLQEKQLEAPKSVWHSEIKRAWVYLEAGLLLRTNAPVAHAVMKARRKSLRAALGAQSAKSKPMPRPASTEESSSSESTSCASHRKAAGYYGKP